MKLKDVKPIHKDVSYITSRDSIPSFVELPCLEACFMLYDKNIATTSSNAHGESLDCITQVEIVIAYDMLSEENKKIAEILRNKGMLKGEKKSSGRIDDDCMLVVPITSESTVEEISQSFLEATNLFVEQDILYGFQKIEDAKVGYEKAFYTTFESDEDLIDTLSYYGKVYDPIEAKVWDSAELLEKHQEYLKKTQEKIYK